MHQATLIGIPAPVPITPATPPEQSSASVETNAAAPLDAPAPSPSSHAAAATEAAPRASEATPPAEPSSASAVEATSAPFNPPPSLRPKHSDEPVATSVAPGDRAVAAAAGARSKRAGIKGLAWLGAVIAVAILGSRLFLSGADAPGSERAAVPSKPLDEPALAAQAPKAAAPEPARARPAPEAANSAVAPEASAAAAAPSASGVATQPAQSSSGPPGIDQPRRVIVTLSPRKARLFHKGKPVGSSPVTIDLEPGEKRRSFEVGMPGYLTRKLVVDGTKPEIFIGLMPDPNATP